MASADLRDELSCSICLNIYRDPVTLKCGHNFCRLCIDRVLDTQEASVRFSCPECREEFQERPELRRNTTLCNIAEKMSPAQTQEEEEEEGVTFCTHCIHTRVPATKCCLHCEAYLCPDHLRIHSKSPEHVLLDPSTSLENRKCSVHRELLRYFCVEDAVCICVSCSMAGQHRGHQVETLEETSVKKKEDLRKVMDKLSLKSEEITRIIEELQENWKKTQEMSRDLKQRASEVFRDIITLLDFLDEEFMAEISHQEQRGSQTLSGQLRRLQAMKDDLARKSLHISKLNSAEDPLTVIQDLETSRGDFGDKKPVDEVILDVLHQKFRAVRHLDMSPITEKLQTLSSIWREVGWVLCAQSRAEISIDKSMTCGCATVSNDLKSLLPVLNLCSKRHHLELYRSAERFSSGKHYWDVEFEGRGSVGVCCASVFIRGSKIPKEKSWMMRKYAFKQPNCVTTTYFVVIHNNKNRKVDIDGSKSKFRISLDYEAGQVSFYELGHAIIHLHTFNAKFTEPLHAAFLVGSEKIKII